jgi:hypothetical protein
MRRFLSKLVSEFRTTSAAHRAPRRASLQVEGLEDRLVLSTASLTGSTLAVNVDPGGFHIVNPIKSAIIVAGPVNQITLQADAHNPGKLQILDNGALVPVLDGGVVVPEVAIASIKAVKVNVAGLDNITVNDSTAFPFASGTTVSLSGTGVVNSLSLTGSRTISGGETYTAGNGSQLGSLTLGGATFQFSSTIGSVTDSVRTTDSLFVEAFGQDVTLSGTNGLTQTLTGLSNGGAGDSLTFSNKGLVSLEMFSASATANLNATAAAAGEHTFVTDLFHSHDAVQVNATPSTVENRIVAEGQDDSVTVVANSSRVVIHGNASTTVSLGTSGFDTGNITAGIKQDVDVSGVDALILNDSFNQTPENVKVTESTISGPGLLGNNAVVHYSDTGHVQFHAGFAADTYTIRGSKAGAHFASSIEIDQSDVGGGSGVNVTVVLDAGSGLNLHVAVINAPIQIPAPRGLHPNNGAAVSLSISAPHGKYSQPDPTLPKGDETVTFVGGLTSDVSYQGFTSVTLK